MLADVTMDQAQTAGPPVVKDTITMSIPGDNPRRLGARICRFQKERTVDTVSPYRSGVYEIDDCRFRRDAPTLAAGTRMAALVPGVKIQAKRRHVRIISGLMRQTQSEPATKTSSKRSRQLQK